MEVNGQNFENVQLSKANEILKNNTHLSITVKTNLLGKVLCYQTFLASCEIWCFSCFMCAFTHCNQGFPVEGHEMINRKAKIYELLKEWMI